jgi:hypothetical protein
MHRRPDLLRTRVLWEHGRELFRHDLFACPRPLPGLGEEAHVAVCVVGPVVRVEDEHLGRWRGRGRVRVR